MGTVAKLKVQIGASIEGLERSLSKAQKSLNTFSKNATAVGAGFSKAFTAPLVGFATASVFAFDKQAKAVAQVEQAIVSTGGAANKTSKQLQAMASALQENSLFGDEEILTKVTAQLLTFTNIADSQFDRTQQAALDLATRLGGDLQSASIQLGKALNDPVANLSALSRAGIQFSEDQKATIDALVETGQLAQAQTVILDELEKQYGGSAKAAAQAGAGGITQLKNSFGDLMEQVGEVILDALGPFINRLKELVKFMQSADKETIKLVLTVGGIAAAIGPVALALAGFAKVLSILVGALAAIVSPIALKIALVAALGVAINTLIHNIEPLADRFVYAFVVAKNAVLDMVTNALKALGELTMYVDKFVGASMISLALSFQTLKSEVPNKSDFAGFVGPLEGLGDTFTFLLDKVKEFLFGVDNATTGLLKMKDAADSIGDVEPPVFKFRDQPVDFLQLGQVGELQQRRVDADAYASSMQALGSKINQVKVETVDLTQTNTNTNASFELLSGIADSFTSSFGAGMANVVVQGEKLQDVLKNIGKLLLSAAIQKGISLLLTGGMGGDGFFGSGGGIFGKLFGKQRVNDALITSSGKVIEFSPKDNILAMQDMGSLGSGGSKDTDYTFIKSLVDISKKILFAVMPLNATLRNTDSGINSIAQNTSGGMQTNVNVNPTDVIVNPPDIIVNPPDIVVNPGDVIINPPDIVVENTFNIPGLDGLLAIPTAINELGGAITEFSNRLLTNPINTMPEVANINVQVSGQLVGDGTTLYAVIKNVERSYR